MRKSRLSVYKQDRLIEHFVSSSTERTTASLVGVNKSTAAYFYHRLREITVFEIEQESHEFFDGEIEVDESYFGGRHKGKHGREAAGKIPVFCLLKRGGRVYTKIIPDASSATLYPIIERKVVPDSIVKTNFWVDHTCVVLAQAASIVGSAVDMETGMRGYLLAGKEGFLDPCKGGEKATYKQIRDLQKTVSDNPKKVARLGKVNKTLKAWQKNVTNLTIDLRRKIGDSKTMNDMAARVGEAKGKVFFDNFRGQIATFIEREQKLLTERERNFSKFLQALSVDSSVAKSIIERVTHTYKVIAQANDTLASAIDMETGIRGYLLAGQEGFLDPYKGGAKRFITQLQDCVIR